jgi:23S rRNA pseudouridine1911/1915/1917 synthase
VPDLPVVYEDRDIMVIDKPAGISVHGGNGLIEQPTVADFARQYTTDPDPERPGVVHRLDKDTSGLLVLAKNVAAKEYMQQQWQNHAVAKTYLLLAVGRVKPEEAVIRLPIGRAAGRPTLRAVTPGGKAAVTNYKLLAAYPGFSYIEARPETGRTHQLRVHFAAIGHPVAGDVQYGVAARPLSLARQFLHAASLSFTAPSGRQLTLTSELPPDLRAALDRVAAL